MAFLFWHSLKLAPARTSKGGIQLRPAIDDLSSLPPRLSWTSRNDTLILNRPTTLEVRAAKQGAVVYILVAFRERERVVQMQAVSGLPWLPVDAFLHLYNCNVTDPSSKHSQFSMTRRPSTTPRVDPIDRPCWYNPSIWWNAEPHLGYSSYSNKKHLRSFPYYGVWCLPAYSCGENMLRNFPSLLGLFCLFRASIAQSSSDETASQSSSVCTSSTGRTPSTHQTRQHILFKMAIERHRPFRHVRRAQLRRYLSS